MKSELLRIRPIGDSSKNVCSHGRSGLHLFPGEIYGFFGKSLSGKNEVTSILEGSAEFGNTEIYLNNRRIVTPEDIYGHVHCLSPINYKISEWSVAEYLMLMAKEDKSPFFRMSSILKVAQSFIDDLGFSIDANTKLGRMNEFQKRLVDLVKAYSRNVHILIIKDPFEGVAIEDIHRFKVFLDRFLGHTRVAIIDTPSEPFNRILSHQYVFFQKGNIVRKIDAFNVENDETLKEVFFGSENTMDNGSLPRSDLGNSRTTATYIVQGLRLQSGQELSLDLRSNQILTILVSDQQEKRDIFSVLSGRRIQKGTKFLIDGRVVKLRSIADCVRWKIVSSEKIGTDYELFSRMTLDENILIPSLFKIPEWSYFIVGNKINRSLSQNKLEMELPNDEYADLDINHKLRIVFNRWLIFRPRVLFLLEPFLQCGAAGESVVISFIHRLSQQGSIVIIIQSRKREAGIAGSLTITAD